MPKVTKSLPVLMHHYICNFKNSIAVSPKIFEEHCKSMQENGWRGISLEQAEEFLLNGQELPAKSCLITFDDGYLDNYLYALPILKKYGHFGTVFAVTNRLENTNKVRVDLNHVLEFRTNEYPDVNEPIKTNKLGFKERQDIFCNIAEIKAMEESNVIQVAGHSFSHSGVFSSSSYSDFFLPKDRLRTFYKTNTKLIWGLPEFTVDAGLSSRGFIPNSELIEAVEKLVPQNEIEALEFSKKESNISLLAKTVNKFESNMGRYETDQEMHKRMWDEIYLGKKELENILGHKIQTLCWPWGKYCEDSLNLAKDAGYKVFITTKEGINLPSNSLAVSRFKVKSKDSSWLLSRLFLYSSPVFGKIYSLLRF